MWKRIAFATAISLAASGAAIRGVAPPSQGATLYTAPLSPIAPTDSRQCSDLDAAWQRIRQQVEKQHQDCLDSVKASKQDCPDDALTGCSCIYCAPYHDSDKLGQKEVAACRDQVRDYQNRERDRKQQEEAAARERERQEAEAKERQREAERQRQADERQHEKERRDAEERARQDQKRMVQAAAEGRRAQQALQERIAERERQMSTLRNQLDAASARNADDNSRLADQAQDLVARLTDTAGAGSLLDNDNRSSGGSSAGDFDLGSRATGSVSNAVDAAKDGEWSGYRGSSSPLVEWQFRVNHHGTIIAADCYVDIRVAGEGSIDFRYDIAYTIDHSPPGGAGHRIGTGYGVRRDRPVGEVMGDCRAVTSVDITVLPRRVGPVIDPDSAHNGTREVPKPNGVPDPLPGDGGTVPGPGGRADVPGGSAAPQDYPNVIVFPGRKPLPDLTAVVMDARSLDQVIAQAKSTDKRLFDWKPVHVWADGGSPSIGQADWARLRVYLKPVSAKVLRQLAADATKYADTYAADSILRQFWRAMSDFYTQQALP